VGSDDIDELRQGLMDDNNFLLNNKTNTDNTPDENSRSLSNIVNSKDLLHFKSSCLSKENKKVSGRALKNSDFKQKALE